MDREIIAIIAKFMKEFSAVFKKQLSEMFANIIKDYKNFAEKSIVKSVKQNIRQKSVKDEILRKKEKQEELFKVMDEEFYKKFIESKEKVKRKNEEIKNEIVTLLDFDKVIKPVWTFFKTFAKFTGTELFQKSDLGMVLGFREFPVATQKDFKLKKEQLLLEIDNLLRVLEQKFKGKEISGLFFKQAQKELQKFKRELQDTRTLEEFNRKVESLNKTFSQKSFVDNFLSGFKNLKDIDRFVFLFDILSFKLYALSSSFRDFGFKLNSFFYGIVNNLRSFISETENLFLLERKLTSFVNSFTISQDIFRYLVDFSVKSIYTIENLTEAYAQFRAIGISSKEIFELTVDTATAFGKEVAEIADDIARALEGDATAFKNLRHSIGLTNMKIKEFGGALDSSGRLILRNEESLERNKKALVEFLRQYKGLSKEVLGTPSQILKNLNDIILVYKKAIVEAFIPIFNAVSKFSMVLYDLGRNRTFISLIQALTYVLTALAAVLVPLGTAFSVLGSALLPLIILFSTLLTTLSSVAIIFANLSQLPKAFIDALKPLTAFFSLIVVRVAGLLALIQKLFSFLSNLRFLAFSASPFVLLISTLAILILRLLNEKKHVEDILKLQKERVRYEEEIKEGLKEEFVYTDRIAQKYNDLFKIIEQLKNEKAEIDIDVNLTEMNKIREDIIKLLKDKEIYLPVEEITNKLTSYLTVNFSLMKETTKFSKDVVSQVDDLLKTLETYSISKVIIKDTKDIFKFFDEIEKNTIKQFDNILKEAKGEQEILKILELKNATIQNINLLRQQAISKYIEDEKNKTKELLETYKKIFEIEKQAKLEEIIKTGLTEAYKDFTKFKPDKNLFFEIEKQEKQLYKTINELEKRKTDLIKQETFIRNLYKFGEIDKEIKMYQRLYNELRKIEEERNKLLSTSTALFEDERERYLSGDIKEIKEFKKLKELKMKEMIELEKELGRKKEEIAEKLGIQSKDTEFLIKVLEDKINFLKKQRELLMEQSTMNLMGTAEKDVKNLEEKINEIDKSLNNSFEMLKEIQKNAIEEYRNAVEELTNQGLSLLEARKKAYDVYIKRLIELYGESEFTKSIKIQVFLADLNFFVKEIEKAKKLAEEIGYIPITIQDKINDYLRIMKQAGLDTNKILMSIGLNTDLSLFMKRNTEDIKEFIREAQDIKEINNVFRNLGNSIEDYKEKIEIAKIASEKLLQLFEGKEYKFPGALSEDFVEVSKKLREINSEFPSLLDKYEKKLRNIMSLKQKELDIEQRIKQEIRERILSLAEKGIEIKVTDEELKKEIEYIREYRNKREKMLVKVEEIEEIYNFLKNNANVKEIKEVLEKLGITIKESIGDKLQKIFDIRNDLKSLLTSAGTKEKTDKKIEEARKEVEKRTLEKSFSPFESKSPEEIKEENRRAANEALDKLQEYSNTLMEKAMKLRAEGFEWEAEGLERTAESIAEKAKLVPARIPTFTSSEVNYSDILESARREFMSAIQSVSNTLESEFNKAVENFSSSIQTFDSGTRIFKEAAENLKNFLNTKKTELSDGNFSR